MTESVHCRRRSPEPRTGPSSRLSPRWAIGSTAATSTARLSTSCTFTRRRMCLMRWSRARGPGISRWSSSSRPRTMAGRTRCTPSSGSTSSDWRRVWCRTHASTGWCSPPMRRTTRSWSRRGGGGNPGSGGGPPKGFPGVEAGKARDSPANLARFQRLHLGIRTKQTTRYISLAEWDRNAGMVVEPKLASRLAYGGLDLGSTSDLTSLCWIFPSAQGYDLLWRYWAPEASLPELDKRTAGSASVWVRNGWLTLTSGNVTDYAFVKAQSLRDLDAFEVQEIGFDPWNATTLTNDLIAESAPMVEVRQGYASLSPPLKEIKRLLLAGTHEVPMLRHGGDPGSRGVLGNILVAGEPRGEARPDKGQAGEKIDGISALTTGMSRAMHHQEMSGPTLHMGEDDDDDLAEGA